MVPTVYSPLTVARKLAGDRVARDLREYPRLVHQALEAITETTLAFVKETLRAGAAGIFFATACATHDFLSQAEYEAFGAVTICRFWPQQKKAGSTRCTSMAAKFSLMNFSIIRCRR